MISDEKVEQHAHSFTVHSQHVAAKVVTEFPLLLAISRCRITTPYVLWEQMKPCRRCNNVIRPTEEQKRKGKQRLRSAPTPRPYTGHKSAEWL